MSGAKHAAVPRFRVIFGLLGLRISRSLPAATPAELVQATFLGAATIEVVHLSRTSQVQTGGSVPASTPHGSQGTQAYEGDDVVSGGLLRTHRATFRVSGRPGRLAVAGARA